MALAQHGYLVGPCPAAVLLYRAGSPGLGVGGLHDGGHIAHHGLHHVGFVVEAHLLAHGLGRMAEVVGGHALGENDQSAALVALFGRKGLAGQQVEAEDAEVVGIGVPDINLLRLQASQCHLLLSDALKDGYRLGCLQGQEDFVDKPAAHPATLYAPLRPLEYLGTAV